MFGFGLFSTHLPYLVLIIGYIACWCWGFQAKPVSDEEEARTIRIESRSDVSLSEEGVVTLMFSTAPLAELPIAAPLLYPQEKDKPRPIYSVPIITGNSNTFSFLRPPPCSRLS